MTCTTLAAMPSSLSIRRHKRKRTNTKLIAKTTATTTKPSTKDHDSIVVVAPQEHPEELTGRPLGLCLRVWSEGRP